MDRNQKNDKIDQNFREIERCLHLYYGEHPEILIDIIPLLSELMNSTRKSERIDNLENLLKILKRKGLHNPYEISALNAIKKVIPEPNFVSLLTKQQNLLSSFQRYESSNIYVHRRPALNQNLGRNNPRRNAIYNEIANFLTPTEFLSFCRCMKLSESEIKEIELQNLSLRTRTLVLLDIFERREIPMINLSRILSLIGREDLSNHLIVEYAAEFS